MHCDGVLVLGITGGTRQNRIDDMNIKFLYNATEHRLISEKE
jgi:hypothetical protein